MKYQELKHRLENGSISLIRVVPIPLSRGWCIDLLIKDPLAAGARADILESDRSTKKDLKPRRFASVDSAAKFLRNEGIGSFRVDMDDSVSFAELSSDPQQDGTLSWVDGEDKKRSKSTETGVRDMRNNLTA